MKGRVLIVAGSDSGGGAGIQADIKTVTALGGYAETAITALTAQDTLGVHGVHPVPVDFIRQQMQVVLADLGADCIKTGMLHSAEVIDAVCDVIAEQAPGVPVVVDPVMVAKGGASLLEADAVSTLTRRLTLIATVLTPNMPEAEVLTGLSIRTGDDVVRAAEMLLTIGAEAVLMKGGHLGEPVVRDVLFTPDGSWTYEAPRIDTPHTHGTGCTLASAVAAGLAQDLPLESAVRRAHAYVQAAIAAAPGYGHGHGPLDHTHAIPPFEP